MQTDSRVGASRRPAIVGGVCVMVFAIACGGGSSPLAPTPAGSSITIVSGNLQTGTVSRPLSAPLVVQVQDRDGDPVPGVVVRWQIIDGGGVLSNSMTATDANGRSQVIWTLGATTGTANVTAVIGSLATQTAQFTATAVRPQ